MLETLRRRRRRRWRSKLIPCGLCCSAGFSCVFLSSYWWFSTTAVWSSKSESHLVPYWIPSVMNKVEFQVFLWRAVCVCVCVLWSTELEVFHLFPSFTPGHIMFKYEKVPFIICLMIISTLHSLNHKIYFSFTIIQQVKSNNRELNITHSIFIHVIILVKVVAYSNNCEKRLL